MPGVVSAVFLTTSATVDCGTIRLFVWHAGDIDVMTKVKMYYLRIYISIEPFSLLWYVLSPLRSRSDRRPLLVDDKA